MGLPAEIRSLGGTPNYGPRQIRVSTTHTRLPMGKIYPLQYHYNHLIESILTKIKTLL
jgi:hypothetical protein